VAVDRQHLVAEAVRPGGERGKVDVDRRGAVDGRDGEGTLPPAVLHQGDAREAGLDAAVELERDAGRRVRADRRVLERRLLHDGVRVRQRGYDQHAERDEAEAGSHPAPLLVGGGRVKRSSSDAGER
jgi:hypothetical protein